MKLLALLPLAVLAADVVVASTVPARHHRIARRLNRKKRCLARPQDANTNTNVNLENYSPQINHPTPTPTPTHHHTTTTTTPNHAPTSSPPPPPPPQSGVINVPSTCGDIGATSDSTPTSGPNGSIYWLNCGIKDGGWNPPNFSVDQVIAKDLGDVLSWPNNPYSACHQHLDAFYKAANKYNLPAILLASIAMQESSCDAKKEGGNGEQGLMQITAEKCPNGYASDQCKDPSTNIDIGASYLRTTLDRCNGNLPRAVGEYNGWFVGMTEADATRARYQGRCQAQNNLDYLHQTFNGWLQGIDPYAQHMGVFFNLAQC